jgi:hypothetical protein
LKTPTSGLAEVGAVVLSVKFEIMLRIDWSAGGSPAMRAQREKLRSMA